MTRIFLAAAPAALMLALAGCGDGSSGSPTASALAVGGAGTTTPTATPTTSVTKCLTQTIGGRSVASLVVPDVLTFDPTQAASYPNGRALADPVVDLSIAALFLDLTKTPVTTLANLPLDPAGNDKPLPGVFPYLAAAWGGAPAATGGSGFVFRTDASTAYTRVDRMGAPAVATVLIGTADKNAYNDDNPTIDATGKWVPEITTDLTGLANALDGQLTSLGLPICAVTQ